MKIYTKIVFDIDTMDVVDEESFEYEGPLALCGLGSDPNGGRGAGDNGGSDGGSTGGDTGGRGGDSGGGRNNDPNDPANMPDPRGSSRGSNGMGGNDMNGGVDPADMPDPAGSNLGSIRQGLIDSATPADLAKYNSTALSFADKLMSSPLGKMLGPISGVLGLGVDLGQYVAERMAKEQYADDKLKSMGYGDSAIEQAKAQSSQGAGGGYQGGRQSDTGGGSDNPLSNPSVPGVQGGGNTLASMAGQNVSADLGQMAKDWQAFEKKYGDIGAGMLDSYDQVTKQYDQSLTSVPALNVKLPGHMGGTSVPIAPNKWSNMYSNQANTRRGILDSKAGLFGKMGGLESTGLSNRQNMLENMANRQQQMDMLEAGKPPDPSWQETWAPALPALINTASNMDWGWLNNLLGSDPGSGSSSAPASGSSSDWWSGEGSTRF